MGRPDPRTLEALGLAEAPRDHPLSYPGKWPQESGLLDGNRLLPLERLVHKDRVPVIAVGSIGCPAQLRHKMAEYEVSSPIPLVKARVTGLGVGVSAHVSLRGYVSASPFQAPGIVSELFVTWLDEAQLAVVDASEGVPARTEAYDRARLASDDFRIELESGELLAGAYVYVNRRGVLHDGSGAPCVHPGERPLLASLLAGPPRLRELFGDTPEELCTRARFDRALCARGTRLFAEEGLAMPSGLEELEGLEKYVGSQQTGSPGSGASLSPPWM
ncbi:hypothetical protein ACFWP7_17580 [Streptomyces sp. NPDC058470]|uniref:hypothetical protein n=1 Tax=Streptomyces sp. NPDC058470 TaxID=3346515 RepID=UPI00364F15EC